MVVSYAIPAGSSAAATPAYATAGIDGVTAPATCLLNPSSISQNASGYVPPEWSMMSVTSSLPQVSLTPQKLSDPSGHGLSGFGPGTVATWPGGKTLSSICLNNGNGSELSLVRLR